MQERQLYEAAVRGDGGAIRKLVGNRTNVNWHNPDVGNKTALHAAAKGGHVEVVRALLQAGAALDATDKDNGTPLHSAAEKGHLKAAQALLQAGADVNAKAKYNSTPLHWAAENGHLAVAHALLQAGADVTAKAKYNETPLHWAADKGHLKAVQALLQAGADVNAKNKYNSTPLHWAAENGHLEVAHALLQAGADVTAKNQSNWTPLHLAAEKGHLEVAQALLQAGADVTAKNQYNGTPLHWAAEKGHLKAVQALLQAGADVNAKNQDNWTALQIAASYNHLEVAQALLQAGADVNGKNQDNWTPLHWAAYNGHLEVAQALLQAGADVSAKNKYGRTPLDLAPGLWPFLTKRKKAIRKALKTPVKNPQQVPASTSGQELYTGGTVSLSSPLTAVQARGVVGALMAAGLQTAVQVAGAVATCNPVALIMAPLQLLGAVQALLQPGQYSQERMQRMVMRIAAMQPALKRLDLELKQAANLGTPVHVVESLCSTLMLLTHVVVQLQELQHKLQSKGPGVVRRTLELLKAGGYEQEVAALDLELRDCVTQLSLVLNIAQFTQVAQAMRAREELQVTHWQQQNEADRARDLQQLEGLMVEAVGGVQALQQQLAEQRVVLDGQVVGLQQVAEWLQQMHASSNVINEHLQQLHSKVDDIRDQVSGMHVDLGEKMGSMQDDLRAKLNRLIRYMSSKGGNVGKGAPPALVIERSRIVVAADALAQGTAGAFGTVIKATHDGSDVAVKVYNHRMLGEIDSEEAMEEALLLSKANHHNVVRCFGIVHDPDAPEGSSLHGSLVMEWVGGGNLYKWLQSNHRSVGLKARVQLALQVAAGMRHLHERKLVHGDLKPQNVLLLPTASAAGVPQAKICDFGLAKHTSTSAHFYYHQKKAYTVVYTSPERIANFRRTPQDDVYAFGILLFFIITGRTPFSGIPVQQLERAIERGVRPDVDAWVAQQQRSSGAASAEGQAAANLAQLAQQCWDAQADKRPTCQEVLQQLATILQSLGA